MQLRSRRIQQLDFQSHARVWTPNLRPRSGASRPQRQFNPPAKASVPSGTSITLVPPPQTSAALADKSKLTFEQGPTKNVFISPV